MTRNFSDSSTSVAANDRQDFTAAIAVLKDILSYTLEATDNPLPLAQCHGLGERGGNRPGMEDEALDSDCRSESKPLGSETEHKTVEQTPAQLTDG